MSCNEFVWHVDPGHAWLEVTTADLKTADLPIERISPYSRRDGDTLYLEEDVDAGVFIALWERTGSVLDTREAYSDGDSFVRKLPRMTGRVFDSNWSHNIVRMGAV